MKSIIVNIGDELLIGQVINTNASYVAKQLNINGIKVCKNIIISDDEKEILNALNEGLNYDLVIITGGLGPTKDDITKHTLAQFMNDNLIENKDVLEDIKKLLSSKNRELNELNKQQALVLSKAQIIRNYLGTAPGMIMQKNNTIFISLPGVPYEMKPMLLQSIEWIKKHYLLPNIIHKTLLVYGIPESELALMIEDWENRLRKDNISLAYLPNRNFIRLRLSAFSSNSNVVENINTYANELKNIIGNHLVGEESFENNDENPVARILVETLKKERLTISFAESCTGGSIAAAITKIPGASEIFKGSVVSYSNEIKTKILNVSEGILNTQGAVSKECTEQMVKAVQQIMQTDIALSVSGIAGPSGGTAEKPVGTVWMSLYFKGEIESRLFSFPPQSREFVIESSVFNALTWILKKLFKL
ncbi:MAG: competence/damage-inducible protein A [Bacteroidia bacterium]